MRKKLLLIICAFLTQSTLFAEQTEDVIIDFNNMNVATSSSENNDGDINETWIYTKDGVTISVSPKTDEAKTPNRFWSTTNGAQLRCYSGTISISASKQIKSIEISKQKIKLTPNTGTLNESTWTGYSKKIIFIVLGNTIINSLKITLDISDGTSQPQAEIESYVDILDNGTMTFYHDNMRNDREGSTFYMNKDHDVPLWSYLLENVRQVVFDESFADARPTTTDYWFFTNSWNKYAGIKIIAGIEHLNTSNVTSTNYMFANCNNLKNLDLSGLDTKNVESMVGMFSGCSNLTSLDLSGFNTNNVTDMSEMFNNCSNLTTLIISGFNTQKVTNMEYMFGFCNCLTILDLNGFETKNITNMANMFTGCNSLTRLDLSDFDTKNVTSMENMFADCSALTSLDLSGFDTKNVTNMDGMFSNCRRLKTLDLSGFNTENVETMQEMFRDCNSLKTLDLSGFNTYNVTNLYFVFYNCKSIESIDLSGFNTKNVTSMYGLFLGCNSLKTIDLSGFNTEKTKNIGAMFANCSSLCTIYCGNDWTTTNLNNIDTFYGCVNLIGGQGTVYSSSQISSMYAHVDGGPENPGYFTLKQSSSAEAYAILDSDNTLTFYFDMDKGSRNGKSFLLNNAGELPKWKDETIKYVIFDDSFSNTQPETMNNWFEDCAELTGIKGWENLNTEKVVSMDWMFSGCSSLTTLDLSNFDTSSVTDMTGMFSLCSNLKTIECGEGWTVSSVTSSTNMFYDCKKLVGGKGTVYDKKHTNADYAHADNGENDPGYLTLKNIGVSTDMDALLHIADNEEMGDNDNRSIYDLQGKRVIYPVKGHCYIKKGKVFIR